MTSTFAACSDAPHAASLPRTDQLSSGARNATIAALVLLLILKVIHAFHLRIDSDEPQHLHTVWGWATGRLPYRDLFDNHMPLFQWLCAPLFEAFGERPHIVALMRLAMIPLFFGTLWCVYHVASRLHSREGGAWAMLLTGFCPRFFFVSSEFRTDDLWTLVWMLALVVLICRPLSDLRAFGAGLLVGTAFAVSMKTSLLLGTMALAGLGVLILRLRGGEKAGWQELLRLAGLAGMGTLGPPLAVAVYFASRGAWTEFVYCVFQHNVVPGVIETNGVPLAGRPFYFPAAAPCLLGAAWWIGRQGRGRERLALLLLASGLYLSALWSYWPILSEEDYEPFYPMFFCALAPLALLLCDRLRRWKPAFWWRTAVFLGIGAFFQVWLVVTQHLFTDNTVTDVRMLADVLNLTSSRDYVIDGKADSIFRARPCYFIMETMTDARFARGLLEDDVADHLAETGAPLARLERLPQRTHRFVTANYLRVTPRLLVLGKNLRNAEGGASGTAPTPFRFEIAIPAKYVFLDSEGKAESGLLDGKPFHDSIRLSAGPHVFLPASPQQRLMLLWANAAEKGYRSIE